MSGLFGRYKDLMGLVSKEVMRSCYDDFDNLYSGPQTDVRRLFAGKPYHAVSVCRVRSYAVCVLLPASSSCVHLHKAADTQRYTHSHCVDHAVWNCLSVFWQLVNGMRERLDAYRRRVLRMEFKLSGSREEAQKYVRVMDLAITNWQRILVSRCFHSWSYAAYKLKVAPPYSVHPTLWQQSRIPVHVASWDHSLCCFAVWFCLLLSL